MAKTHVILLTSSAYIRARFVRRESIGGGFVITTNCARARRYEPIAAAKALGTLQQAIAIGGFTSAIVPVAAYEAAP